MAELLPDTKYRNISVHRNVVPVEIILKNGSVLLKDIARVPAADEENLCGARADRIP